MSILPAVPGAPLVGRPSWRHDAPASIVVFLVALPLCLGVALASGAPLISGVIAGVVGGVVVGSLSGSHLMVSGPAAGLTAIVLAAITQLGDYRAFLVAVVIGGLIQLVLAAVRAGIVGYYFPSAVIKGMLSAIGLVLILKQVPHALGYDSDSMGDTAFAQADGDNTFTGITHALNFIEPGALLISAVSLAILFAWPHTPMARLRMMPAPLVVVLVGTGLNAAFTAASAGWALGASHLVSLPLFDGPTGLLAAVTFPAWEAVTNPAVWRIGLTLGIVASIETLLSLEATDKMDPFKREAPPNRELLAQGVGNTLSGLIGGLPITGVIVRSAANVGAGARTRWSAILHGLVLLAAVALMPAVLNRIPLAALAAILLHTGWKLAHPGIGRRMHALGRSQAIPYFTTVLAILFTDLLVGITIGLAVGAFFILADTLRAPPFTEVSPPGAVLRRLELHHHVNFLNKGALLSELEGIPDGSRLELDGRNVRRMDLDALEVIHDFRMAARSRGIDYRLVGIPPMPTGAASAH
jgi:MFS superfamily sulfate permease-like transporter